MPEDNPEPQENVSSLNQSPPDPTPEPNQQAVVNNQPGRSKGTKFAIIFLLVFLAGVLGFLGYKAFIEQSESTASSKQDIKQDVPLIRIGRVEGTANSFYPNVEPVSTNYSINNQVFESLVQFQDVTKVKPSLATSWTTPDDNTWVFELKKDVKFHSGNTMTAKDVKASLEKYSKDVFGGAFSVPIKEITTPTDYQVKLVTSQPDPLLLHKLAYLYIVDSTSTKEGDPANGTGPYEVKPDTTPTETNLELTAFEDYHGGHVYSRELNLTIFSDEAGLYEAANKGDLDYVVGVDTVGNIDKLKQAGKFQLTSDPGLSVFHMGINHTKTGSPVQKLKFRQALDMAINRNEVIKASNLKAVVASQIVPQDIPGYNPEIKATATNIEGAKKLLTEAGYPNGATITLSYSKDLAEAQAQSIAKQLKAIGVTVTLDPQVLDDLFTKVDDAKTETYLLSYSSDLLDASDPLAFNFQSVNYSNSKLDELLDASAQNQDEAKRLSELKQASKLVMDDIGWLPIYTLTVNTGYSPDLMVHRGTITGPYFWQVYKQ